MILFMVLLSCCALQSTAQDCGTSPYEDAGTCDREGTTCTTPKVVGGVEAREHELPYQVSLLYFGSFFCGGILLDEMHVLTAAHCTAGDPAENHEVVVAEHIRNVDNENKEVFGCTAIVEHEDYNGGTLENDIAIMTLDRPVDISNSAKVPVCFAQGDYTGQTSVVSGWGGLRSGGPTVQHLNYASIDIMSFDECEICDGFNAGDILPGMLCAGNCGPNDKDTCQGDSGGPLAVKDNEGLFTAVGITSWGYGCADDTPGVYADIPYYEQWIRDNLG